MKDLDLTLDYMENARFNYVYGSLVTHMDTIFSNTELLCISMIYHKFVLQNGPKAKYMTQVQLSKLIFGMFKINDVHIRRRIVLVVCSDPDCTDPKFSPLIHCSLHSFIKMIGIYFSKDLETRMQFAYRVYDEVNLGYLNREHVMRYVENFFTGEDEDEIMELRLDMLEMLFIKFDLDKDMTISYENYIDVVRLQPDLLEFLGKVFPSKREMESIALCFNLLP